MSRWKKSIAGAAIGAALLVGGQAAFAATVYESEPNNMPAAADAASIGDTMIGYINYAGDPDFYGGFTTAYDRTVNVSLEAFGDHLSDPATYVVVIIDTSPTGDPLPTISSVHGYPASGSFIARAGHTYYAMVTSGSAAFYNQYILHVY